MPEALDLAQPDRQRVPTRKNPGHQPPLWFLAPRISNSRNCPPGWSRSDAQLHSGDSQGFREPNPSQDPFMCARLRGVAGEPRQTIDHTNKAEVLKTLAASFSSCDAALSSLTGASANELVPRGPVEIPKSAAVVGLLAHAGEMYGIATVYLRAKNIVPPSTARQKGNR
jgi:hypothetical protein